MKNRTLWKRSLLDLREADLVGVGSHGGGSEGHSSRQRSGASPRWDVDHSASAALQHARQHQPGHQSGDRDVPIHQIQQALLGYFHQALRGSPGLHTVHQEADIFALHGFFDGVAGGLVQREVSRDYESFHSVALGEGSSRVSDRGEVLRDKDNADSMPGQLLYIGFGYRLCCTWRDREQQVSMKVMEGIRI